MKLDLAPDLKPGELPTSYLSRLAAAHGISAAEFCSDWRIALPAVVNGKPKALAKLAGLGGLAPDDLAKFAFVRQPAHDLVFDYRGESLGSELFQRRRIDVCPICLEEDLARYDGRDPETAMYLRADWCLETTRACPTHERAMVTIVDDLGWGVRHDFVALILPRQASLAKAGVRAVSIRPSLLQGYVAARLEGKRENPFLDAFPLYAAVKTCEVIGATAMFGRNVHLGKLEFERRADARERGFEIASEGSDGIKAFLKGLQGSFARSRKGLASYGRVAFETIHRFLTPRKRTSEANVAFAPLRLVVSEFIKENYPLAPGELVFDERISVRTLHSVRSLSTETGMNPRRLLKLLREARLVTEDQMDLSDRNVVFDAERARLALQGAQEAMSVKEAAERLGLTKGTTLNLVREGSLRSFLPATDVKPRIPGRSVADFMERLLDGAQVVRRSGGRRMQLRLAARELFVSEVKIVRWILEKRLRWVGRLSGAVDCRGVLVVADEVKSLKVRPPLPGLGMRELALALGTSDWIASALVRHGHLGERGKADRRMAKRATAEDVQRFKENYVSAWQSSLQLGRHVSILKQEMAERGVKPAFDPKQVDAVFYRRSDVLPPSSV